MPAIDASALAGLTCRSCSAFKRRDGERRLLLLRRAGHAGDDDFLQAIDVALEGEVERLRASAERDLTLLRKMADGANAQHDGLAAHPLGRYENTVTTLRIGRDRNVQLRDERIGAFHRLAGLGGHDARQGRRLREERCER